MSKKSRKVVDNKKINEVLNQKGKDMLGEAFEGVGGVVTIKPIHNMDGAFSQPKQQVNETLPAFPKEIKELEKSEIYFLDSINKLGLSVGKVDKKYNREVALLYKKYLGKNLMKFKEEIKDLLAKLS